MIVWILSHLTKWEWGASLHNLSGYISVRSTAAAVTTFLLALLLGPAMIRLLQRLKWGQPIRGKGIPHLYERHREKQGTPTMGGLLILVVVSEAMVLWGDLTNRLVLIAISAMVFLGAVGIADDWLKLRRQDHRGVKGKVRLLLEFGFGLTVGLIVYVSPLNPDYPTSLSLPLFKSLTPDLGILYIFFVAVVITGCSNGVNLSDGLDGLAVGCLLPATLAFGALAYIIGRTTWCDEFYLMHVAGAGELTVFCSALFGASMAFLWFNAHPAQVFMGDTGALSMGGALGTVAVLLKQEALLLLIGGIFFVEALSVIFQVISFKTTGRRIFRMSPLHHHFEMKGWPESRIVIRFWILASILGMLGVASIKVR
jgi:phospho-N-acetylmuramoyl-pentapeptide-transferase